MLPHSPKNNQSFHNLSRELLPLMNYSGHKPPRLSTKQRHHPKDFSGRQKIGYLVKHSKKKAKVVSTEIKSILDPIPDGRHTSFVPATGSTLVILPPVSQAVSVAESSLAATLTTSVTSEASTAAPSTANSTYSAVSGNAQSTAMRQPNSLTLSPVAIGLLAVGSALVFLGVLIILKVCSRPAKRLHQIPSNPILLDEYEYTSEKYPADESPIFGGKDRLSTTNSGHMSVLLPWTQYHSGIPGPATATGKPGANTHAAAGYVPSDHEKDQYPFSSLVVPSDDPKVSLQPIQNAVARAASRLSTASMSQYPNSPRDGYGVGLAIDGASFVAESLPVLPHTKSVSRKRSSNIGLDNIRDTAYTRYSQGFAYSPASDLASPTIPRTSQSLPKIAIAPVATSGGRARVKSSYYAPGSYPRASSTNLAANIPATAKANNALPFLDSVSILKKSGSHRDRERHALTSALGFASPIPLSPQQTLYPDDSLSMAGDRSRGQAAKGNIRSYAQPPDKVPPIRHRLDTPPMESAATLGSLMLQDFGSGLASSKSLKDIGEQSGYMKLKRTDDKPPRVPSPPPLPSLSQMGLQHANPEAYATYRSPTYSIYLTHADETARKSKASSFGY